MGKRAHGEGTITKRKNGYWMGQLSLGYKDDGTRNRKSVYGKTQREVREKLEEIKQQFNSGTLPSTKHTMRTYLQQWLDEKERQVKARTAFDYRYDVEKYILPRLGQVRLDKLTPLHVQTMMSSVADEVSADRANKCRARLNNALGQAVRWQLLPRNPVEAVDKLKHERQEMQLWTPQQAANFLDTAKGHRLYPLFYVAMAAGLHSCELLGLRWQDVRDGSLYIRHTFVRVGSKLVSETTKTAKGKRRVAISPDVVEVLEQHRLSQRAEAERFGEAWPESDLVFVSTVGTPLSPDNLRRLRHQLMEKAGVPRVKLHELRHLHSSICIANGMDPKMLADRLGHSRASFTLDVYTHLFEEQRAASAVSLLNFLPKYEPDDEE